jgi:hypothetical protein
MLLDSRNWISARRHSFSMTHPVRRSGSELPTLSGTKIDIALYMVSVSQGFMCENTFLCTSAMTSSRHH